MFHQWIHLKVWNQQIFSWLASLQNSDCDESSDVKFGGDRRKESENGRGQEAEAVDPFDTEHFGQTTSEDLSGYVTITVYSNKIP